MPLSDHLTELGLLQGSDGNPPPKSLDLLAAAAHGIPAMLACMITMTHLILRILLASSVQQKVVDWWV